MPGCWLQGRDIAFWQFAQLEALHVGGNKDLNLPIIRSLSTFPNLRTLSLDFYWQPSERDPRSDERRVMFSALETLSISGRLVNIGSLMAVAEFPRLQSVALSMREECRNFVPAKDIPGRLFPLLSSIPRSVRSLQLCLACDRPRLLPYTNLQEVVFSFPSFVRTFCAADFLRAALATWPLLSHFELGYCMLYDLPPDVPGETPWYSKDRNLPSIHTLAAFVERHPHLRFLSLPGIDFRSALPSLDPLRPISYKLRYLHIIFLPDDVPLVELAQVLDRLLPALDLRVAEDAAPYYAWDSDELRPLLLALRTSRRSVSIPP
ncbi:hypothetical protein C8Q79DRAFT_742756 [Trametes meyenii]|nr:hypothetical protein C8Q79DRAFT_742756 [Trametes meyenii]